MTPKPPMLLACAILFAMLEAPARAVAHPSANEPTASTASSASPAATPACITYWPETRARAYGYDHVVHVKNACAKVADCRVSTDVAPEPIAVDVPAAQQLEVITFICSPATTFTPKVDCTLRS